MTAQATAETPAARPSRPSLRLTALVMPTIQRMVKGQASGPSDREIPSVSSTVVISIPVRHSAPAAAISARNLTRAGRPLRSSISPMRKTNPAVQSSVPSARRFSRNASPILLSRKSTQTIGIMAARKMANPPILGIGRSCTVRTPGRSTALMRRAIRITRGVTINANRSEPRYTQV